MIAKVGINLNQNLNSRNSNSRSNIAFKGNIEGQTAKLLLEEAGNLSDNTMRSICNFLLDKSTNHLTLRLKKKAMSNCTPYFEYALHSEKYPLAADKLDTNYLTFQFFKDSTIDSVNYPHLYCTDLVLSKEKLFLRPAHMDFAKNLTDEQAKEIISKKPKITPYVSEKPNIIGPIGDFGKAYAQWKLEGIFYRTQQNKLST